MRYSISLFIKRINREIGVGLLVFAALVAGLQWHRGAFGAEFTAQPDEAAHFVTSLMVRDYLSEFRSWPPPAPMPWAGNYYLHYPKVALGHWPPGYYMMQAAWWLVFPIGRFSAMLLNTAMAAVAGALLLAMARRIRPGWPAAIICVVMLAAPVTRWAAAETMADLPSLLCGLLVLYCLAGLLQAPAAWMLLRLGLAVFWALMVKGTGVALLLGPVLAVAGGGVWRRLDWRWLVAPGLAGGAAVAWFLYQNSVLNRNVLAWGGVGSRIPWYPGFSLELAGPGLAALAIGGAVIAVRRGQPEAWAALAVAVSIFVTSYFVRAMQELRHWIVLLPALLLLALVFYAWLEKRSKLAPLTALAAVCFFPFHIPALQPVGFAELASRVKLPSRMLISSADGWPEGSWIAEIALREPRPGSTIVRGSKLFAQAGWNTKPYRLLTQTAEEMERAMDEAGVETVILHTPSVREPVAHHVLLTALLRDNPRWRNCDQAGQLSAYCRVGPAHYPRKPVRIDLRERMGSVIEEKPE